jgi:hypothetical protein
MRQSVVSYRDLPETVNIGDLSADAPDTAGGWPVDIGRMKECARPQPCKQTHRPTRSVKDALHIICCNEFSCI